MIYCHSIEICQDTHLEQSASINSAPGNTTQIDRVNLWNQDGWPGEKTSGIWNYMGKTGGVSTLDVAKHMCHTEAILTQHLLNTFRWI